MTINEYNTMVRSLVQLYCSLQPEALFVTEVVRLENRLILSAALNLPAVVCSFLKYEYA